MAHFNTINTNGNDIDSQLEELVAENRLLREQLSRSEETIAAHKQTEAALHEQVRRFSELLGLSLDWTWEVDATATYTYVSPNVRDFFGYEPEEMLGKTPFDFMPPHEAERVGALFGPIAAAQQPFKALKNVNLRKDGSTLVLETSGLPIVDQQGNFRGYRGIDRDITTRSQMEDDLRVFKTLVENAPLGICVTTLDGTITYHNPAYLSMHGYETMIGLRNFDLVAEENHQDIAEIGRIIHEQGAWVGTMQGRRNDGSLFPIQISLFIIRQEEDNTPHSVIAMVRDMTEQQRAEQERMHLQQQVIEAQRADLRELSSPLIPLSDRVVMLPLIGSIDSTRAEQIMETLLEGVAQRSASTALIDITGVSVVDTQVADALIRTAQAVKLLGAEVILTGIGPVMAQTLIHLGANLSSIVTLGTLQNGIAYALNGKRVWR